MTKADECIIEVCTASECTLRRGWLPLPREGCLECPAESGRIGKCVKAERSSGSYVPGEQSGRKGS